MQIMIEDEVYEIQLEHRFIWPSSGSIKIGAMIIPEAMFNSKNPNVKTIVEERFFNEENFSVTIYVESDSVIIVSLVHLMYWRFDA